MKRLGAVLLPLAALMLSPGAHALGQKTDSVYDYRIKSVVYNPIDVTEINGLPAIATNIVLAPNEQYVKHVFGSKKQWEIVWKDNNVWVRPIDALSDTNLTLVSNKRTYYFVLHYLGGNPKQVTDDQGNVTNKLPFIQTPWAKPQATLAVIFKYPFEDMAVANEELEKRRVRESLEKNLAKGPKNLNYRMSDDPSARAIEPLNVWDNYRFTYFKFPENAELPTITVIGADGKELVANATPVGANANILEVDRTAKEWRIRLGDKVVGLVNGGFNPSLGATPSGTVAPDVERVLKGNQEAGQ
ncbi:TPA: TrbG/VirB9 family P-type conjugative transfer protein [Pseudomonas putida]